MTCPNGRRKRNATTQNSSPLPHAFRKHSRSAAERPCVPPSFRMLSCSKVCAWHRAKFLGARHRVAWDTSRCGRQGFPRSPVHATARTARPTANRVQLRMGYRRDALVAVAHRCWRPSGRDRMSVDGAALRGWIHSECIACVLTRLEMVLPHAYTPLAPVPVHMYPLLHLMFSPCSSQGGLPKTLSPPLP